MGPPRSPGDSDDTPSGSRLPFLQTTALPAPYQLAIEELPFGMTVLDGTAPPFGGADGRGQAPPVDGHAAREVAFETTVRPPMWFSVTPRVPLHKRYVYLVQQETDTGLIVLILLFDRAAAGEHGDDLRLPPSGAWLRAVVDGSVYVLASDLVLSRKSITAWIGGDEPPTTPAMPPYA